MDILFLILIILSAILLVIVVMMQDEQGEGLGGIFGGGGSSTPFGSRSGNVLTKITAILAAVFLISTLGLAFIKRTPRESRGAVDKGLEDMYESSVEELWYADVEEEEEKDTESTLEMPLEEEPVFSSDITPDEEKESIETGQE
jgi:preprotein translocase subunit SecG